MSTTELRQRGAIGLLILVQLVALTGCASFRASWTHGGTLRDRKGHVLRTSTPAGSRGLEIERGYDRTLNTYVENRGVPDYIAVLSRNQLVLVYLERDEVAAFNRHYSSQSTFEVHAPITDKVLRLLEEEHQQLVLAARAAKLPPTARPPDGRQPTVADVAEACFQIALAETDREKCEIGYTGDGVLLVIDFGYPADEAWGSAPEVARTFCLATNASNRPGFVTFQVEKRTRAYSCELGRWGEWLEEGKADTPL